MSKFILPPVILFFIAILLLNICVSCSSINNLLDKGVTEALPIVGEMELQNVENEIKKELPKKSKSVKKMPQYQLPEHISL